MASSTKTVSDKGISVLFEATSPTLDIVFVHGFTGHPERTWSLQVKDATPDDAHSTSQPIGYDTNVANVPHSESSAPSKRRRADSLTDGSTIDKPRPPKLSRLLSSSFRHSDSSYDRDTTTRRNVYWPRDLVPETLPNARVLTYGYDTNVRSRFVGPISKNTVRDHGWDLLCALDEVRREDPSRPLLFVCHSLGGLVSKIALMRSNECRSDKPHLHNIFESTIGVFFFGTPHRGADPLGIARGVLTALAKGISLQLNDSVVATLMPGGDYLRSIHDGFVSLGRQRQWVVFSFQEEYGLGGLRGNKVVDDESSRIDDASLETTRHIAKNHMDMVRFSSSTDPEYRKVASALRFVIDKISSQQVKATEEATQEATQEAITQISCTTAVASTNVSFSSLLLPVDMKEAIESRKELKDLLYFDEVDARLLSLKTALTKTCHWFLEKPEYLDWLHFRDYDTHHGFLWIKGKPGAGKSILMKFLEAKTRALVAQRPDNIVTSFFFFAPGKHLERSTLGLYRSLLWQLFEKVPDLAEVLDGLDANARRVLKRTGWQVETLKETLERAVERLGRRELCIFIDALDECHDDDVADMVEFFEDLGDKAADNKVRLRICFSSRYYPTIVLKTGTEVKLDHEQEHSRDITRYIKAKLKLDKSKRAGTISQQIMEKSAGIFLWVALVVPILNKAFARGRMDQLQKCLKEIPPGLDSLFDMILTRDVDDLDDLRLCIQWILFSIRPLTLVEYFFALRDADDTDALSCWAEEELDKESMHRFVENSSKGLAEVTKTRSKTKEPTVQFIHESVRDYFLLKEGKRILWPHLEGDFVSFGHESLKNRCLAEITNLKEQLKAAHSSHNDPEDEEEADEEDDENDDMFLEGLDGDASSISKRVKADDLGTSSTSVATSVEERPLLRYATMGVLQHSDLAQRHGFTQSDFLIDELPSSLWTWIHLYNKFEKRYTRHFNSNAGLLYILAALGLPNLLSIHPHLPAHNDRVHWRSGRYFFPFAAAVILKHMEAARILAASLSADPEFAAGVEDAVSSLSYQPTRRIRGHHAFFDLLLELDHPPLLSHYIELWHLDFQAWLKGQSFAGVRSSGVATLLLKNTLGLRFGSYDEYTTYPRIQQLILRGADSNTRSLDGSSALHWMINLHDLSRKSPTLMVTLMVSLYELFDYGIDKDLRDSLGRTPLHLARSPELVSALITHVGATKTKGIRMELGAPSGSSSPRPNRVDVDAPDVNAVDNNGQTPLFFMRSGASISTLIKHGANIHATDLTGKTALFYSRDIGTISVLLQHGADVNAVDNTGKTPLFSQRRGQLVNHLLQNGANCKATDSTGKTPLHTHRTPESLSLLIRKGGDIHARDHNGQTPLHWHVQHSYVDNPRQTGEIMATLINNGADIFAKDLEGKTPLDLVTDKILKKRMVETYEKLHPASM